MATLQVIAAQPLTGKSAIAAGIALGLSSAGFRVRLERAGTDEPARRDAGAFADLTFVSSSGRPLDEGAWPEPAAGEVLIVEAPAGRLLSASTPALLVVRAALNEGDVAVARPAGENLVGTVATSVLAPSVESLARELTDAGLRPLALVPEDRLLAAPSVGEIRDHLGADLLYDGENEDEVVEEVLIGPVYADPARPHFRRFTSKAVLTPFNKTDLLLAAIESGAACIVITGNGRPSPYVLDRAQGEATTLLQSGRETPQTLSALAGVWESSRFKGEAKAQAVLAHLSKVLDFPSLARKLESVASPR